VTNIAGVEREFDTEITEQHPDEGIAWRSVGGDAEHAGVVTLVPRRARHQGAKPDQGAR
jgi:uncharacterized membrane protein